MPKSAHLKMLHSLILLIAHSVSLHRPAYVKRFTSAVSKEISADTTGTIVREELPEESFPVARGPTGEFVQVSSDQEECK